jgi:hypothetical protein
VTGGPGIRFYAGAVIQDANGFTLGSLVWLIQTKNTFWWTEKCIKIVGKSSCFIVGKKKCWPAKPLKRMHFIELSKI